MEEMERILQRLDEIDERLLRIEKEVFRSEGNKEYSDIKTRNLLHAMKNQSNQIKKDRIGYTKDNKVQSATKSMGFLKRSKSAKPNLEMEFGGKWINRIGIIALVFAVAFFLKYSFDNNLVGPQGRIFIGALFGISMLVSGDLLFKKYRIPSEGLMGGGIAVLCFTVYAAFDFYGFIGQNTAFSLFVFVICASSFLAIRHDAIAIMHLGVLTGFLTPFLLSTGKPNDVFFLSYLVILNLGIMVISYFKSWKSLFYLAFFATHICYMLWMFDRAVIYDAGIRTVQFFTGFVPMIIIFLEFLAVSLLMNISKLNKKNYIKFDFFLIFMNAIMCYAEGYYLLDKYNDNFLGIFTVMAAVVYLLIFSVIKKYEGVDRRLLVSLLSIALIFITIAIPVQLEGRFITLAWAVEAVALAYISLKTEHEKIRVAYIVVAVLALIGLIMDLEHISGNLSKVPFLNIDSLIYVISVMALFVLLWIIKEKKANIKIPLSVAVNLLLMGFLLAEASNIIDQNVSFVYKNYPGQYQMIENYMNMRNLVNSLIILLYSISLISVGFYKKVKSMRIFALALFLIVIFKVFLFDLSSLEGIYRILSFVALGFILLGISFVYQRYKDIILGGSAGEVNEEN